MNIIQMVERIKSYQDIVNSPRHDWVAYEDNIMTAINQIVNDRYDNIKKAKQQKTYAFETVQRIRDELYTIIVNGYNIVPTGTLLPVASIPANYRYLLGVELLISGSRYIAEALSYNEKKQILTDPYKNPKLTEPYRVYYLESATGVTCFYGSSGVFTNGYIDYLRQPIRVNVGQRYNSTHVFAIGNVLIATEPTVYNGVTYDPGETITIVTGFLSITSGEVCFNYVNCDLPESLHEEICKVASGLISKTVEDYQKGMIIDNEANK